MSFDELVPTADMASLMALGERTVSFSPPGDWFAAFTYLAVNHVGPNNQRALTRLDVRRAIVLGIDKAAIVQVAGGPRAARALRQVVGSSSTGFREGADQFVTADDRGNPEAARRLLAGAGLPSPLRLRLAYMTSAWGPLAALALQASLERAGFAIDLVPLPQSDLIGRLLSDPAHAYRGEWDLALAAWGPDWFGGNNGRSVLPPLFDGRLFGRGSTDFGGYDNPEVNRLFDKAVTARDAESAEQDWFEAARRLMSDVAHVPLVEYKLAWARSRRVRGCAVGLLDLKCDLTVLWLDKQEAGGR